MNREAMRKREAVIVDLIALEKKHGQELTLSAMRKRLTFIKEESSRLKEIAKLEKELVVIRGKIEREKKGK